MPHSGYSSYTHGTFSIDGLELNIERRLARIVADDIRNGYSGRRLHRQYKDQNLVDISIEPIAVVHTQVPFFFREAVERSIKRGEILAEEQDLFLSAIEQLEQASQDGTFFAMRIFVLAAGRKP